MRGARRRPRPLDNKWNWNRESQEVELGRRGNGHHEKIYNAGLINTTRGKNRKVACLQWVEKVLKKKKEKKSHALVDMPRRHALVDMP